MSKQFINKHTDSQLKTDLLFFWNRYPYAKFTAGVIAHSVSCIRKADVEEALEDFVSDEIIEKHTQQGQPFYCLTSDRKKRETVLKLSEHSEGTPPMSASGRRQRVTQLRLEEALSI